ncbi:MAG: hypothetical protein IKI31_04400, partial [Treponema sp.]|nr:hypothetical protein [Treponema sp.]
ILQLQESGIPSGIDNNVSYPVVLPIVVLAFAFFLLYLSRKKAVFALGSFFPILLSFCSPFYSLASSLMLLLYAIYLSCLFWKRKNAFNYILKNFVIVLFFASSVFIAFFTSPKSALLFCICVLGVLCVLYSKNVIDELFDKKYTFKPVLIRSAKSIKTFTNFSKSELLSCSVGIFLLLFFSFFSTGNLSIKSKKMIFPSAHSNGITDTLPVLEDYFSWYYETLSSPYKRLEPDSKKNKSTSISFPRYKSTENGIVLYNESYSFDDSFFEKTVAQIDELPYPALEKMIKAQGQNIKPGYSSNTAQKNTIFHTILIIFALVVPVLVLLRSKNI